MKKIKFGQMKTVFRGDQLSVKQREIIFPDGSKKIFEYCQRPDSVTILPFDNKGRLLLIREFRYDHRKSVWFLPAGRVDKGETPIKAARRELREETGFDAKILKKIFKRSSGSSVIIWNIHVFVAKNLRRAPLDGDEQFPIKVVPTPLAQAVKMALSGAIENEFISYHIIRFNEMLKRGEFKW